MKITSLLRSDLDLPVQESVVRNYVPLCGSFKILDASTWTIAFRKHHSRHDEDEWITMKLGEYYLPPTALNRSTTRFYERPEICNVICATIDSYLIRLQPSKSTASVARSNTLVLVKLFEYGWLNGLYSLSDWRAENWQELRSKLQSGGWSHALDLRQRTAELVCKTGHSDIQELLSKAKSRKLKAYLNGSAYEAMGTNAGGANSRTILDMVLYAMANPDVCKIPDVRSYPAVRLKKPVYSSLVTELMGFDLLADAPPPYGLGYVPTPNSYRYADKHGTPGARTFNLTPDTVADLLVEAYKWVYERGPAIIELLADLNVQLRPLSSSRSLKFAAKRSRQKAKILKNLKSREAVEKLINLKVSGYTSKESLQNPDNGGCLKVVERT